MQIANEKQLNNAFMMGIKAGNALNIGNAELCRKLTKAFNIGKKHFIDCSDMQTSFDNGFLSARKALLIEISKNGYQGIKKQANY